MILKDPEMNETLIAQKSSACCGLLKWVKAVVAHIGVRATRYIWRGGVRDI